MGKRGGGDMDDEGDKERKESRDGMWGQAEKKRLGGVTLSCQLVLGANARVTQKKE